MSYPTACPPGAAQPTQHLRRTGHRFRIPEEHFAAAQLPEQVTRAGRSYVRPEKWRASELRAQRLSEPAAELAALPASSLATGTRNGEQDT
jgi:hypothetical protein